MLAAVEALSYHASASARDLRMQRTRTIAFVYYDYHPQSAFVSPYIAGVLNGLSSALQAEHHFMLPCSVGTGEDLGDLDELLHSGRVDGAVLRLAQDPPVTDDVLEIVASARIPCVTIERPGAARFGVSSVTYDDEVAAFIATSYLIKKGHKRIGHLRGDPGQVSSRLRADGYRRALAAASLPLEDCRLVQGGGWNPSDGIHAMRLLLELDTPPTAVFAANDQLAIGAIDVLRDRGIRIPSEMAVVGFDDVPAAQEMLQPLTTVRIPFAALGRRAAALILRAIETHGSEQVVETVPLDLIQRATA